MGMTHEQLVELKKDPIAYRQYRDKINEYRRRPDVKEKIKKHSEKYRKAHRDELNEKTKAYQKTHKDEVNAYQRNRRRGHKSEDIKEYNRNYMRDYRKIDKNKRIEQLEDKLRSMQKSDDKLIIQKLKDRIKKLITQRDDYKNKYQEYKKNIKL